MANQLVQAIYDLKDNITAKLKTISESLRGHKADSDKTADAVTKNNQRLSDSYAKSADGLGKLKAALAAVVAVAGLDKIKDELLDVLKAGEHFDDLDKRFATAFGGLDIGRQKLAEIEAFAKTVPLSFDQVADAAVRLRQFGFDPLDGTLQALIDNQQALNGSFEDLSATIDTLGKAQAKGVLSTKALVQLVEQGVPAFDLLSQATGKSTERIHQLAENGQLGKDAIKALITELGKVRAGAAASELGDIDSQLQKLKDSVEAFRVEIAKSGALDVFRAKLAELNQAVREAAESGQLKVVAQRISDGVVATASAIGRTIQLVVDYSGALLGLAKAYAAVKIGNLVVDVALGARAMLTASLATRAAAKDAVEAGGRFGQLGAAIRGLPTSIKIAITAVALEFTLEQLVKLVTVIGEYNAIQRESQRIDADLIESKAKLAEKIAALKTANQHYAQTVIETSAALKAQNQDQLKAYQDQLQGAITYFRTLRTEAKLAGNEIGFQDATAKLKQFQDALTAAKIAAVQAGESFRRSLSEGAREVAHSFDGAAQSADQVADRLKKLFAGFDDQSVTQLGDIALGLVEVAKQSDVAGVSVREGLGKALHELSGEQLLQFQSAALATFGAFKVSASEANAVLDATLLAGLDRLGVSASKMGVAFTAAGKDIIAAFTAIVENARASGAQIEVAFKAAIGKASTVEEIQALGAALEDAANRGRIGFEATERATSAMATRLSKLKEELNPLADAFSALGIKSQQSLNDTAAVAKRAFDEIVVGASHGKAAQEDVQRAFVAYAQAQLAAAANAPSWAKAQIESQLRVQASVLNVTEALKAAGLAGETSGDQVAAGYDKAKQAIDDAATAAGNLATNTAAAATASANAGAAAATTATQTAQASGAAIALTNEQTRAMQVLNEELFKFGNLSNIGLSDAQFVLQELGGVIGSQADELRRRIQELTQTAQVAEQVGNELKAIRDRLLDAKDQAQGDQSAIENRRFAEERAHIEELAKQGGFANRAVADEARALAEAEHVRRLKQIEEEKNAKLKADSQNTSPNKTAASNDASAPSTSRLGALPITPPKTVSDIHIHIGNFNHLSPGDNVALQDQLARFLTPALQRLAFRSR